MVSYLNEIEKSAYHLLHELMPTKVCFFSLPKSAVSFS